MIKSTGRGRRPGQPDTKERIRLAARQRFLADGYEAVTMRSIASTAGVDVALVSYYFGSKRGAFGAAMALTANPAEIIDAVVQGDFDTLAERLLTMFLAVWDDPLSGAPLVAMAGAAMTEPDTKRLAAELVQRELVARLADGLAGPDATERAAAFCTQISGLVFSRYLLAAEPIASMPAAEVVRYLAPSLQKTLETTKG